MSSSQRKIATLSEEKTPAREPFSISKEDFEVYEGAIDTYLEVGKKKTTVRYKHREKFLAEHPLVAKLLAREGVNPLLREGIEDDRKGEHYLTYEMLALLLHIRIIEPKNIRKPKHIVIHDNDEASQEGFIRSLKLNDGDDALLVSVKGIHATFQYIYQDKEITKCIYVDSEPSDNDYTDRLKTSFKKTKIYISEVRLQKDYFSCATFTVKLAKHCVKQGKVLFDTLDTVSNNEKRPKQHMFHNKRKLALKDLPPALRKMSQEKVYDDKETVEKVSQQIVSAKSQKSLSAYLLDNELIKNNSRLNIAAIKKKYKYLDILERWLESNLSEKDQNALSSSLFDPLPKKLATLIGSLKKAPEGRQKVSFDLWQIQCDKLYRILATDDVQLGEFSYLSNSIDWINQFRREVHSEETFKLFIFLLIARHGEDKDSYLDFAKKNANKLFALFESCDVAIQFLKSTADFSLKQPIHDACLFELPASMRSGWNVDEWRKLVNIHGKDVIFFLAVAPQIEGAMNKHKLAFADLTLEKIKQLRNQLYYANSSAYPEMADLCMEQGISEKVFDQCVQVMRSRLKTFDVLPNITIRGEDLKKPKKQFTFKKLDTKDWRGLRLGDYTFCCQSVGEDGSSCAIHGMSSPYSSFYVVVDKKDKIIAQSWAWMGENGTVVFDSIESKGKNHDIAVIHFFLKAADKLLEEGATAVYIGNGGNTPAILIKSLARVKSVAMLSRNSYSDAKAYSDAEQQSLLARKAPEEFSTLLKSYVKKFSPSESKLEDTQATLAIVTGLPADDLYQIGLRLFRSGFHLFEELYKANEIATICKLIDILSAQQVINLLELMDPHTKTPFLHRLTQPKLSPVNAAVQKKVKTIPLATLKITDAQGNNFLHEIARSGNVDLLKLIPATTNHDERNFSAEAKTSDQNISNDSLITSLQHLNSNGMNPLMLAAKHLAIAFIHQILPQLKDDVVLFKIAFCRSNAGNNLISYLTTNKLYDTLFAIIPRLNDPAISSQNPILAEKDSFKKALIIVSRAFIDSNDKDHLIQLFKLLENNNVTSRAVCKDALEYVAKDNNAEIFRAVYATYSDPETITEHILDFAVIGAVSHHSLELIDEIFNIAKTNPQIFNCCIGTYNAKQPMFKATEEIILSFLRALDDHPKLQLKLFDENFTDSDGLYQRCFRDSSLNHERLFQHCVRNHFDRAIIHLCERNKTNKENIEALFGVGLPKKNVLTTLIEQANQNNRESTEKTWGIIKSYCDFPMLAELFLQSIDKWNQERFELFADFYEAHFTKQELSTLLLNERTSLELTVFEKACTTGVFYTQRILALCHQNITFAYIVLACKKAGDFNSSDVLELFLSTKITGVTYPENWQKTLCSSAWDSASHSALDDHQGSTVIESILKYAQIIYTATEIRAMVISTDNEGLNSLQFHINRHFSLASKSIPFRHTDLVKFLNGISRACGDDKSLVYDLMAITNSHGASSLHMVCAENNNDVIITLLSCCPPHKRKELMNIKDANGNEAKFDPSLLQKVEKLERLLALKNQLTKELSEEKLTSDGTTLFSTSKPPQLKQELDALLDPMLDTSQNICYEMTGDVTIIENIDKLFERTKYIPIAGTEKYTQPSLSSLRI